MRAQATGVVVIDDMLGGITPGLPCVLAGPSGSGRTVLSLQLAAAALEQGRVVTLLCNEPAPLLLRQAATLGLDLETQIETEQLVLLEMDSDIAALTQAMGADALIDTVRAEQPLCSLLLVDPLSVVTAGIFDESQLRATARAMVANASDIAMVLTVESERLALQQGLERILGEICGAFLHLTREEDGARRIRVEKARTGVPARSEIAFEIGEGGMAPIDVADGDPTDASEDAEDRAVAEATSGTDHAPGAGSPLPMTVPPGRAGQRPTILVVDSDQLSRDTLSKWLSDRYEVITVTDGFEAMTWLMTGQPDLVVLDLIMPRVTGYELLGAFQRSLQHIPRLVISGRVKRPGDRLAPLVLGATDLLAKPIERFELLHKIEVLLRLDSAPTHLMDPLEAANLFATISKTRLLEAPEFGERLARAGSLGERLGLPSSLVTVASNSSRALDEFLDSVDDSLRFEDASLRVSQRRAVLLLVATEAADASDAIERLCEVYQFRGGRPEQLTFRIKTAEPVDDDHDWHALFRDGTKGKSKDSD